MEPLEAASYMMENPAVYDVANTAKDILSNPNIAALSTIIGSTTMAALGDKYLED